jgi:hypothetical protein
MAFSVTLYSLANEALAAIDRGLYGRRVESTRLEQPPVFIIGHWRTGTTFLHELLSQDDRFACPSTYECMAPHHFLLTGRIFPTLFKRFAPSRRPMDDMPCGVERPQEDDIALLALGAPTPMARVAFPNEPPPHERMIDGDAASAAELAHWRQGMCEFVKRQTFHKRKRLLLKSPPHTGKVAQLAELFPGARFIHLVRSPREVFASSRRLWQALDRAYGMQIPHHRGLDDYIFDTLRRMYAAFERQRPSLAAESICDVAYERLVEDPLVETRRIYEHLGLDDFEACRAKLEGYLRQMRDYQPNVHQLEPALAEKIDRRWTDYARLHQAVLEGEHVGDAASVPGVAGSVAYGEAGGLEVHPTEAIA